MTRADLGEVDRLCRLVLAAGRSGCHVVLVGLDPDVRQLLELAGVRTQVAGSAGPRRRRGALRSPTARPTGAAAPQERRRLP